MVAGVGVFMASIVSLISYGVNIADEYKNLIIENKNPPSVLNVSDNKINFSYFEKSSKLKKKNLLITEKVGNLLSEIKEYLRKHFSFSKHKNFLNNLSLFWTNWLGYTDESSFLKNFENEKQKLEQEAKKLNKTKDFKKIYKKMQNLAKLWLKLGVGNDFSNKIFKLFLNN